MSQIFISYSRKDIAFVRRLAGDLEKAGYSVWWDVSGLRGGDDWVRVIPAAIQASDMFVVVLSPNSAVSQWVEKEYTQALHLRRKIIPIMLEKSDVPFGLNNINYIDFTSNDYAANLNRLLNALEYTGEPVMPAATVSRLFFPALIGILFLVALLAAFHPALPIFPSPTPTHIPSQTPIPSFTLTDRPTWTPSSTSTMTSTMTPTPTITKTFTPRPTSTASPTKPTFDILIYCVNSLYANTINVRSGPGTIYAPLGEPLQVGKCLAFSARNEDATWLQIAGNQADPTLQQYGSGWIFRELLGLGSEGPIDLPAVTLTPTSAPSDTPGITATFTPTDTPLPIQTMTSIP